MKSRDLSVLRLEIDRIDQQIIELLADRMDVVKKIGNIKKEQNIPPLDKKRWQEVLQSRMNLANKLGLDSKFIKKMYGIIHNYALEIEI